MPDVSFLDAEHGPRPVPARVDGRRVWVTVETLAQLTGWRLEPEGLCRDDVCVPVRDAGLAVRDEVDVARFAAALGRPAVVDAPNGLVALGASSVERRGPIEAGVAPDFTLPRLEGGTFTLSSVGRRKKLLLAWASW